MAATDCGEALGDDTCRLNGQVDKLQVGAIRSNLDALQLQPTCQQCMSGVLIVPVLGIITPQVSSLHPTTSRSSFFPTSIWHAMRSHPRPLQFQHRLLSSTERLTSEPAILTQVHPEFHAPRPID